MKVLAWMLILTISLTYAQPNEDAAFFSKAKSLFAQGKYQATVEELATLERNGGRNKAELGLIYYWKGICFNKLQNYPKSIESFDKALGNDYVPQDIHYEYGQALYASEKYPEAQLQFRESLRKKFKRAVSLYYIGFISKEMGDRKKAATFFKAIEKLPKEESEEVRQAAEFQIGDVYYDQVEKGKDAFRAVETYVIPQYKKALEVDENSNLAQPIRDRIVELQRKYDLIMFNLRNGRPVLNPPHFLRASLENGVDTNVTFSPTETTVSKSKQSSFFTKGDVLGRYTFYHENWMSFSPELRFNYTYYHNRVPEIYRNDNYLIAPALRTSYEHTLWNKPASVLVDYEYSQAQRDVKAEKKLVFSSRSHTLMLGERFNFFNVGESILRLRMRKFDSYNDPSDSQTLSLVYEQVISLQDNTLLLYTSLDQTKVEDKSFDTNALTVRGDFIMSRFGNWGTPSVGLALTSTDPVNNRSARGRELLINPNARVSRIFGKNWRGNLRYDYQDNQSKDKERFAFKKSIYSLEIEYLF